MKLVVIPALYLMWLSFATVGMNAQAAETHPCKEDIAKFCKDVKSPGGKIYNCLKEHENELSQPCKAHQEELKRKISNVFQVCKDDVAKFCKDEKPGSGRIFRCLKANEAELSAGCREQMGKRKYKPEAN